MHDREHVSSLTHFVGFLLSIAGLVLLLAYAALYGKAAQMVGFSVFGTGLILLYLSSAVYHFISKEHPAKAVFRVIDYSMIYVLIAGTYTPVMLSLPERGLGWTIFGVVWGLAAAGIVFEVMKRGRWGWFSSVLYLAMGWLALLVLPALSRSLPPSGVWWLAAGGLLYTAGIAFFSLEKQYPRRGWFGMHEIFHLFVMAGSFAHFWFMFKYVLYLQ
ncbi:hemolysin III family protein [Candidatus Parcubacteria bacterium]|nr:hemolysin III family protein [Candidatus Parcubacteria bacterium]